MIERTPEVKGLVRACNDSIEKWESISSKNAEQLSQQLLCRPCSLCDYNYFVNMVPGCEGCPLYIEDKSCYEYGMYKRIYTFLENKDWRYSKPSAIHYFLKDVQDYSQWLKMFLNDVIARARREANFDFGEVTEDEIKTMNEAKGRQAVKLQNVRRVEDMPVIEKKEERVMRNPIDMYGNVIHDGDYINYPVRHGSDMYMRTAKVVAIRERADHVDNYETVLDIQVAIPPRDFERADDPNWEDKIRIKKTTLFTPHRATIIPKTYIQRDRRYRTLVAL